VALTASVPKGFLKIVPKNASVSGVFSGKEKIKE
jgi:hypothetical protein